MLWQNNYEHAAQRCGMRHHRLCNWQYISTRCLFNAVWLPIADARTTRAPCMLHRAYLTSFAMHFSKELMLIWCKRAFYSHVNYELDSQLRNSLQMTRFYHRETTMPLFRADELFPKRSRPTCVSIWPSCRRWSVLSGQLSVKSWRNTLL